MVSYKQFIMSLNSNEEKLAIKHPEYYEGNFKVETGELHQLEIRNWKIDVPRVDDSIFSSIVLAFLLPVTQTDDEFEARFQLLTANMRNKKIDHQDAKNIIKRFNPFVNNLFLYRKEKFYALAHAFQWAVYYYVCENEKYFADFLHGPNLKWVPTNDEAETVMQVVCYMLHCRIALISEEGKLHLFPRSNEKNSVDTHLLLTFYQDPRILSQIDEFHFLFGLEKNVGLQLQKSALGRLLQMAGISDEKIEEILLQPKTQNHLLASLLINRNFEIIETLYQQSYIVSKLSQAGFKILPMSKDLDGKTSFFYAMENGNDKIIRILYDYSSGSGNWDFFLHPWTHRNPDETSLNNLKNLKSCLEITVEKFDNLSKLNLVEKQERITFVRELIKFNNFQVAVCADILAKVKEYETIAVTKQLLIDILSKYEDHSNMNQETCFETSKSCSLFGKKHNNYMKYYQFYNILDQTTALLFIDVIFLLKENLPFKGEEYEKIESSILYFMLCSLCYKKTCLSSKCKKVMKEQKIWDNSSSYGKKLWYNIIFLERLKLENSLKYFKDLLKKTNIIDEETVNCLAEHEIKALKSHPIVRDTFILKRIMHYVELATEVDLKKDWKLGMLIMERALQVLAETLNTLRDSGSSITLVESLLVSSFPLSTQKDIQKIRNLFFCSDRKMILSRFEMEEKKDLLINVQEDMKNIKIKFSNMLEVQMLREFKYVYENGLALLHEQKINFETLSKANAEEFREAKSLFVSLHFEKNMQGIFEPDEVECLSNNEKLIINKFYTLLHRKNENKKHYQTLRQLCYILRCMETRLDREISMFTSKKFANKFKSNIDLLIQHVREHLQNTKTIKNPKDVAKKVNYHLACIRPLLRAIVRESQSCSKSSLRDGVEILELTFIPSNDEEITVEELNEKLENIIHEVNEFYQELIAEIKVVNKSDHVNNMQYPGIAKLIDFIKHHFYYLTEKEKETILKNAGGKSKEIHNAKKALIESLESRNFLSSENAMQNIQKLCLKKLQRKTLEKGYSDETQLKNNLCALEKVKDDFGDLKNYLTNNKELSKEDYKNICNSLKLTNSCRQLLLKIVKQNPLEGDRSVEFIMSRITLLEELLIKSKPDIEKFWSAKKREEAAEHMKKKILQHYMQDPKLQAAVEMLVYDCVNFCRVNKEFQLPHRDQIFTGINLFSVLRHGKPLLETIGSILDPSKLPSKWISTAVELITSKERIKSNLETCGKFKNCEPVVRDLDAEKYEAEWGYPDGYGWMQYTIDQEEQTLRNCWQESGFYDPSLSLWEFEHY